MTPDEALAAFAAAGHDFPYEAMQWALHHWDEAAPPFLDLLGRYADGQDRGEAACDALFFVIHLIGEKNETRAFPALCRLMRQADAIEEVLGDAETETLKNVVISAFDGDFPALKAVIEDEAASEFVRGDLIEALAYLTATGRHSDDAMRDYLLQIHDRVASDLDCYLWAGWVMAVANLGYEDLVPLAEDMIRRDDRMIALTDVAGFRKDLDRTRADPERLAGFRHDGFGPFRDAIGTLARWHHFSAEAKAKAREETDFADEEFGGGDRPLDVPLATQVNPLRHVGRNDPCPCGSGKKYKKCCLGKPFQPAA